MRADIKRWCLTSTFCLALLPVAATAQDALQRKLDAWLDRDASQLLMEWRVDGDYLDIEENDDTGETLYTWRFWNEAWNERVVVGSENRVVGMAAASMARGQVTSMVPVQQSVPIYGTLNHPASLRCTVIFRANPEDVIDHWKPRGDCKRDARAPKR
ncbi:hypothetical protein EBB59_08660 [Lysobacter pythonis]|uniref:Uncharacterized protein n=1 Tax=Solilutibacter pythonis TaxID=2483112 RepID=A0A3M2HUC0_9GAMM|nr:hypothetical protein [Lysobacter pythonis]RMH91009.1 hypothetical protein EBB59_08660 [Lysobacter pythonis]